MREVISLIATFTYFPISRTLRQKICQLRKSYKYQKGKRGKSGIEYLAYVVYKVTIGLNYIYQDYRQRFGIETSYRLKNICRIRTTTKNPIIRLLYVGISFLIVNIWIYILWSKISKPRRGGRLVYQHR